MNELTSLNRKKRQRKLNKLVRRANSYLRNDPEFKDRYYIKQEAGNDFKYFEDKSGAMLITKLRFIDKLTGIEDVFWDDFWEFCDGVHIWTTLNQFICDCHIRGLGKEPSNYQTPLHKCYD